MSRAASAEFKEELRVAAFWRARLGEQEFWSFAEDDLYRWYKAMQLRGEEEVREHLAERSDRYSPGPVTGLVSKAPHPPRRIVELWLEAQENRFDFRPLGIAVAVLLILSWFLAPMLSQCANTISTGRLPSGQTLAPR
jgi:hypothetical protein